MSDAFLSYNREDRERLRPLVKLLEQQGWEVWWDRRIPAGKTFAEFIEQKIGEAKCVVVVWSVHSAESHWVKLEAAEGRRRGILIPAMIDNVTIPFEFRDIQTAKLFEPEPAARDEELKNLLTSVAGLIGKPIINEGAVAEARDAFVAPLTAKPAAVIKPAPKRTNTEPGDLRAPVSRNRLIATIATSAVLLALVVALVIYLRDTRGGASGGTTSNANANTDATPSPQPPEPVEPGNIIYSKYDSEEKKLWLYLPLTFQKQGFISQMDGRLESTGSASAQGFNPTLGLRTKEEPPSGAQLSDPVHITSERAELTYSLYFLADDALGRQVSGGKQQRLTIEFKWRDGVKNIVQVCFAIFEFEDGSMVKEKCP
jgi:hypothetical protein